MQSQQFKEQFFSQIYDEHVDKVYRFVLFKVSSEVIAQDITSETFTRLWKEISMDKEIRNPSGFLFSVARNMITDHYRLKDQNPVILDNPENILDNSQDIAGQAVQKDDMRIITAALGQMDNDYRLALSMYYIEQEPISEVAKALGKSQGATRVIIHRGMKQLRQILEA
ncbi:MAG: sigma-70 family RNA polymerase sigma factor [Candidatus Paceibacterota bacterium]|jgi:RNA polymerase sigma-70 factor (ECF subfamily)